MLHHIAVLLPAFLVIQNTSAFRFISDLPGVDSSLLHRTPRSSERRTATTCPFNSNHTGAAPYSTQFPYSGARNGLPGTGIGGYQVPAPGDTAHYFEAPGPNDIRGPCPGLNAAANHHFLSHDGITTYSEILDAVQNMYNVGYDLANAFGVIGVGLSGDFVTGKLSIGCDATSRTSATGSLLGEELGLDGHNKIESDSSLSRNDYYLANGDNYSFNGTLFADMQNTCQGNFNRDNLSVQRSRRYHQSLQTNGQFYFGPMNILIYGAVSFVYELFPTDGGPPDLSTISSFFGVQSDGNGGWTHVPERIPEPWFSRATPYTIPDIVVEMVAQYTMNPVLLGGNDGVGNFDLLNSTAFGIQGGKWNATSQGAVCLIYQVATQFVPDSVNGGLAMLEWITGKLNPVFEGSGCPLVL